MARTHFLSPEIVPPIDFDWAGNIVIFLDFGDLTFALLMIAVLVAYISARNR